MNGALKLGIALILAAAAVGLLVVAAAGARERGRVSYCRNNLRKLGEMAFQKLASGEEIPGTGRRFWQEIRVENFTNVKGGMETWVVRFAGLNPFGCPVRGVQPLDLAELSYRSPEDFERLMKDPATIDYRGPRNAAVSQPGGPRILGADREGNHPGGRGHVLLVDLSVREVRDAVVLKLFSDAPGAGSELSD